MARKKRKGGGGTGLLQFLPVLAVVGAMGFDYYATVFVFLDNWIPGGVLSDRGLLHAGVFTWVTFMCSFSFCVSAISDPGSVPANYVPDAENPQNEVVRFSFLR
jgi:palmitoyltransferase ZDHHC3/7/25